MGGLKLGVAVTKSGLPQNPQPEWSVGGLKLGGAVTKSGWPITYTMAILDPGTRLSVPEMGAAIGSRTGAGLCWHRAAIGSRTAPKGGSAPEPLLCPITRSQARWSACMAELPGYVGATHDSLWQKV